MLLSDASIFLQLMSASALSLGQSESTLYDMLMGVWWEKVNENVSYIASLLNLFDSSTT